MVWDDVFPDDPNESEDSDNGNEEIALGTDPYDIDSDSDGIDDDAEIAYGTDPTDEDTISVGDGVNDTARMGTN